MKSAPGTHPVLKNQHFLQIVILSEAKNLFN